MSTIDALASSMNRVPRSATGFGRRITIAAVSLTRVVSRAMERRRSRLFLLELTDDQLKDIGISRADAYREGIRAWWE